MASCPPTGPGGVLVSVAVCVLLLLPQLIGMAFRFAEGRMPPIDVYWRSSPGGVDVLSYVVPNPNHAWFGDVTRTWFIARTPFQSSSVPFPWEPS